MAYRGHGHGGPAGGRLQELPLIKMVEKYLVENKHKSFINLEDMGKDIRAKSYRYSRMKQAVFKEQLKRAYQSYSETAANTRDDFGEDIEFDDDTPLDDNMLKQMDGYPTSSDEDEFGLDDQDEVEIAHDPGRNQMNILYAAPTSSTEPLTLPPAESVADQKLRHTAELAANIAAAAIARRASESKKNSDCVSVSSSSTAASNKSNTNKPPNPKASTSTGHPTAVLKIVNDPGVDDIDSGSDLEIVDEVHNEPRDKIVYQNQNFNGRPPVAVAAPTGSAGHAVLLLNQTMTQNLNPNSRLSSDLTVSLVNNPNPSGPFIKTVQTRVSNGESPAVKNNDSTNRGNKRKTAPKADAMAEAAGGYLNSIRKKSRKEVSVIRETGYKLKDFAGSEKVVEEICKLVTHLMHPEMYKSLEVTPPRGFLLHGPPGTGKTLLVNAIAGELCMPLIKVAGTELVSGISGESENNIRELFSQAVTAAPCIVFIDEIDSVTPRRETVNKEMERRIVAQLLACIDDLGSKENGNQVLLVGATNRIDSIDTALRRAGRFDREICLGIPDESSREKILNIICGSKSHSNVPIKTLAKLTPGYVGADLQALVREAALQAVDRMLFSIKDKTDPSTQTVESLPNEEKMDTGADADTTVGSSQEARNSAEETQVIAVPDSTEMKTSDEVSALHKWIRQTQSLTPELLQELKFTMKDYEIALKSVQPSSKREGFATVPDTTWDDIGALQDIRDELQVSILGPVKHPEAFKELGLTTPAGVLLCGPPGCGKTLLAKAVANEAGINFISVKGPELLNMYVGESERAVRQCFQRARNSSPCVIFFDELDALCPRRSDVADSGSGSRIVNQLLTEMDGMESRQGVFVMAATNRPDIIDPAVLRPGRLDKILFVNLPTPKDRLDILKAITKNSAKPALAEDVNLEEVANDLACEDYTGADLAALVREASIAAFRELVLQNSDSTFQTKDLKVYNRHFKTAFTKTKPSVSKEDRHKYKVMAEKYSSSHK